MQHLCDSNVDVILASVTCRHPVSDNSSPISTKAIRTLWVRGRRSAALITNIPIQSKLYVFNTASSKWALLPSVTLDLTLEPNLSTATTYKQ